VRLALLRCAPGAAGRIVLDRHGTMRGRGAYLCADADGPRGERTPAARCLELAVRRGGVSRTLRTTAKLDAARLPEKLGGDDLVESIAL